MELFSSFISKHIFDIILIIKNKSSDDCVVILEHSKPYRIEGFKGGGLHYDPPLCRETPGSRAADAILSSL